MKKSDRRRDQQEFSGSLSWHADFFRSFVWWFSSTARRGLNRGLTTMTTFHKLAPVSTARDKRALTHFTDKARTPNRGGHLSDDREASDRIPPAPTRGFSFGGRGKENKKPLEVSGHNLNSRETMTPRTDSGGHSGIRKFHQGFCSFTSPNTVTRQGQRETFSESGAGNRPKISQEPHPTKKTKVLGGIPRCRMGRGDLLPLYVQEAQLILGPEKKRKEKP